MARNNYIGQPTMSKHVTDLMTDINTLQSVESTPDAWGNNFTSFNDKMYSVTTYNTSTSSPKQSNVMTRIVRWDPLIQAPDAVWWTGVTSVSWDSTPGIGVESVMYVDGSGVYVLQSHRGLSASFPDNVFLWRIDESTDVQTVMSLGSTNALFGEYAIRGSELIITGGKAIALVTPQGGIPGDRRIAAWLMSTGIPIYMRDIDSDVNIPARSGGGSWDTKGAIARLCVSGSNIYGSVLFTDSTATDDPYHNYIKINPATGTITTQETTANPANTLWDSASKTEDFDTCLVFGGFLYASEQSLANNYNLKVFKSSIGVPSVPEIIMFLQRPGIVANFAWGLGHALGGMYGTFGSSGGSTFMIFFPDDGRVNPVPGSRDPTSASVITSWKAYTGDGIVDIGTSPSDNALIFEQSIVTPEIVNDMRIALESVAGIYEFDPITGTRFTFQSQTSNNLYFVAMGDRTKYGAHDGAAYTWTRNKAALKQACFDIDIGEIFECVEVLKLAIPA